MTASAGAAGVAGMRREQLREKLRALGFDEVRFAAAARPGGAALHEWLDAGRHADMAWMERTADKRLNPDLVLAGAKSVIILVRHPPVVRRGRRTACTTDAPGSQVPTAHSERNSAGTDASC